MSLKRFQKLFQKEKLAVIGMIHVKALPGTPKSSHTIKELVQMAKDEAKIYTSAKVDGVLIENMWDVPYIQSKDFGPEVISTMTRISNEVRSIVPPEIPCGIQILAGGNAEALAVSKAADLQFIRAESFLFSHVADEGWMDACAGNLLRYRKKLDAQDVLIFADIKKKHCAHAVTSDVTLKDTAKAAELFLADGVVLTGTSTGEEVNPQDLHEVKSSVVLPVLIGSGITTGNVKNFSDANGLIIGSHFKSNGKWTGDLEAKKILKFMETIYSLREK